EREGWRDFHLGFDGHCSAKVTETQSPKLWMPMISRSSISCSVVARASRPCVSPKARACTRQKLTGGTPVPLPDPGSPTTYPGLGCNQVRCAPMILLALQSHARGFQSGSGGFQGDAAGNRGRLQNGQATALKRAVRVRFAVLDAVHVAVADADDAGRSGHFKIHFCISVRNAHAVFVHDPKFNVADILAVGSKWCHVREQLNPARRSRRFHNVIANLPDVT